MSQPSTDTFSFDDCCDFEVDTHINYFLERLPETLHVERVLELTLDDPAHALKVLIEVRDALVQERHKAQVLLRLKAMQTAAFRHLREPESTPAARSFRHSELL
ncbi:MAG: hypothetical protein U0136_02975 [Bdellovibrionota bacterium]